MDEDRLLSIVGGFYEAVSRPGDLGSFGKLVQKALDIESTILFLSNHDTGELVQLVSASDNFDPVARADYRRHYHHINPWYQATVNQRGPLVGHGEEFIETREFERTEFRADWCTRVGIYHMMGGIMPIRGSLSAVCGVHRPEGSVPFAERDRKLLGLLMEHIGRACQFADKLGLLTSREALSFDLFHRLNVGVMLLDESCRPILLNAVAERLVKASRWFTSVSGRLRPVHPSSVPEFERRVGHAARTSAGSSASTGGVLALRDPLSPSLQVLIAPFKSEALALGTEQPAAAVVFSDPDTNIKPDGHHIAELFGLTAAEGRLVAEIASGRSLIEAAQVLGVSANTAKTQLKSVFAKTGWTRQAELTASVLSDPIIRFAMSSHR